MWHRLLSRMLVGAFLILGILHPKCRCVFVSVGCVPPTFPDVFRSCSVWRCICLIGFIVDCHSFVFCLSSVLLAIIRVLVHLGPTDFHYLSIFSFSRLTPAPPLLDYPQMASRWRFPFNIDIRFFFFEVSRVSPPFIEGIFIHLFNPPPPLNL